MSRDVLVTGFEPWAHHKSNPSGDLATELGGVVLPTRYRDSERALLAAVRKRKPAAVVMLGLAETREAISVEAIALNVDHAEIEDNAGRRRLDRTIDRRGPLALPTRLPAKRIVAALRRAKIPAQLSQHAGTFCCNHIFYVALRRLKIPCGFVHVPPFETLPRERQRRAVEIIIKAVARRNS